MALNDAEHKAMQEELDALKKAHAETTDAIKQQKATDTEEARKAAAKGKERPGATNIDPDMVKEVAAQKIRIEALEKKLGTDNTGGSFDMVNFFGDD